MAAAKPEYWKAASNSGLFFHDMAHGGGQWEGEGGFGRIY